MEDTIIKILKSCRGLIEPAPEFKVRSRRTILETPRRAPSFLGILRREAIENLKFTLSLSLATILVVAIFSGIASWKRIFENPWTPEGRELLTEAESLNFDIELGEDRYFSDSAKEIASLLGEIRESEATPVDTLLDQIIF